MHFTQLNPPNSFWTVMICKQHFFKDTSREPSFEMTSAGKKIKIV